MREDGLTTGVGRGRQAAAGFTLVEILSAMALAVLIMIGLAQVFKMSSEAVAEAEATSDGYQQARGALNAFQRDLAQFAEEGYLWIVAGETRPTSTFRGSRMTPPYYRDTLYFTAAGSYQEQGMDTQGLPPTVSGGAEVVYTLGWRARVGKPTVPYESIDSNDDDPRTMLLVRKAFLVNGGGLLQSSTLGYSSPGLSLNSYVDPDPAAPTPKPNSCLALMMTDRWPQAAYPRYRVAAPIPAAPLLIQVEPTWSGADWSKGFEGYPDYKSEVNYVVAERVSEFFVEVWEADATGKFDWRRDKAATAFYPPGGGEAYARRRLWCGNAPRWGTVGSGSTYSPQPNMPNLIRVTMVIHPHNDTARLLAEPYAGNIADPLPAGEPRYRGQVFREVFRINGVVQHAPRPSQP